MLHGDVSHTDSDVLFCVCKKLIHPETNSSHLKMDSWNTRFFLGWPIFRGFFC